MERIRPRNGAWCWKPLPNGDLKLRDRSALTMERRSSSSVKCSDHPGSMGKGEEEEGGKWGREDLETARRRG